MSNSHIVALSTAIKHLSSSSENLTTSKEAVESVIVSISEEIKSQLGASHADQPTAETAAEPPAPEAPPEDQPSPAPAAPPAPEAPEAEQPAPEAPPAPSPEESHGVSSELTAEELNSKLIGKYNELTEAGCTPDTVMAMIKSIIGADSIKQVNTSQYGLIAEKVQALTSDQVQ